MIQEHVEHYASNNVDHASLVIFNSLSFIEFFFLVFLRVIGLRYCGVFSFCINCCPLLSCFINHRLVSSVGLRLLKINRGESTSFVMTSAIG